MVVVVECYATRKHRDEPRVRWSAAYDEYKVPAFAGFLVVGHETLPLIVHAPVYALHLARHGPDAGGEIGPAGVEFSIDGAVEAIEALAYVLDGRVEAGFAQPVFTVVAGTEGGDPALDPTGERSPQVR